MNNIDGVPNKDVSWWNSLTHEQQNITLAIGAVAIVAITALSLYFVSNSSNISSNQIMNLSGKIDIPSSPDQSISDLIKEIEKLSQQNGGHFSLADHKHIHQMLDQLYCDLRNSGYSTFQIDNPMDQLHKTWNQIFSGYDYNSPNPTVYASPQDLQSFIKQLQEFQAMLHS